MAKKEKPKGPFREGLEELRRIREQAKKRKPKPKPKESPWRK